MSNAKNAGVVAYQAMAPTSRARRAAWILLLLLAVVTMVIGLCMGGMMCGTSWLFQVFEGGGGAKAVASEPATGESVAPVLWGMTVVMLLVPLLLGVIEIVCSMKIRKRSRGAAVLAAFIVGLQLLGMLFMMAASIFSAITSGQRDGVIQSLVMTFVFGTAMCGVMGLIEYLLIKVIREKRELAAVM